MKHNPENYSLGYPLYVVVVIAIAAAVIALGHYKGNYLVGAGIL